MRVNGVLQNPRRAAGRERDHRQVEGIEIDRRIWEKLQALPD
jgi:hypothetical protein